MEHKVLDLVKNFTREKTFAEFVSEYLKDKLIQIYVGDSYEDIKFEQHSMQYPALFCGKVLGAFKECLIVSPIYKDGNDFKFGKVLFINERAIRALSEIDGKFIISDMFLTSKDTVGLFKRYG